MSRLLPELQKPLHIDTDIDYSLDMDKFPGLDDPQHKCQPALVIGTSENVAQYERHVWSEMVHGHQAPTLGTPQDDVEDGTYWEVPDTSRACTKPTTLTTRDLLEELLHIIDSSNSGLLDRILDSSLQGQTAQIKDVKYSASGLHQPRNEHLNVHGRTQYQEYSDTRMRSHEYVDACELKGNIPGGYPCKYSNMFQFTNERYSIPDYLQNLSALSYQTGNTISRKRCLIDDCDQQRRKRECYYNTDPRGYCDTGPSHAGFLSGQHGVFHENLQNIRLVM